MIVGFTGTQLGMREAQQQAIVRSFKLRQPTMAWHGDCVGADAQFHRLLRSFATECKIGGCIPDNDSKRAFCDFDITEQPLPYLQRNHNIVDRAEIMLACPAQDREMLRSGTWATIRYAQRKHKPILLILPSGDMLKPLGLGWQKATEEDWQWIQKSGLGT